MASPVTMNKTSVIPVLCLIVILFVPAGSCDGAVDYFKKLPGSFGKVSEWVNDNVCSGSCDGAVDIIKKLPSKVGEVTEWAKDKVCTTGSCDGAVDIIKKLPSKVGEVTEWAKDKVCTTGSCDGAVDIIKKLPSKVGEVTEWAKDKVCTTGSCDGAVDIIKKLPSKVGEVTEWAKDKVCTTGSCDGAVDIIKKLPSKVGEVTEWAKDKVCTTVKTRTSSTSITCGGHLPLGGHLYVGGDLGWGRFNPHADIKIDIGVIKGHVKAQGRFDESGISGQIGAKIDVLDKRMQADLAVTSEGHVTYKMSAGTGPKELGEASVYVSGDFQDELSGGVRVDVNVGVANVSAIVSVNQDLLVSGQVTAGLNAGGAGGIYATVSADSDGNIVARVDGSINYKGDSLQGSLGIDNSGQVSGNVFVTRGSAGNKKLIAWTFNSIQDMYRQHS